jgi:hypothetical protein
MMSALTRFLAHALDRDRTRRDAIRAFGGLALAGPLALGTATSTRARRRKGKKRNAKRRGSASCSDGGATCVVPGDNPGCTPLTDAAACQARNCGVVIDACGHTHNCGRCTGGAVCSNTNGGLCQKRGSCHNAAGPGRNLAGLDLAGCDLTNANLRRSNLARANLTGAILAGADLSHANLGQVNLSGATLLGADLTGANLTGITWSHTICPDGSNSDAVDGDAATCLDNLTLSICWKV